MCGTWLSVSEIEVLSRGLNFCPTTKIDPSLSADTEEFIRRMRLQEFFHKPQEANSEHNEAANEPEQPTERSTVQRPKRKESNWTLPEGRCPRLTCLPRPSGGASTPDSSAALTRQPRTSPKHNATPSALSRSTATLSSNQQTKEGQPSKPGVVRLLTLLTPVQRRHLHIMM